MRSSHRSIGPLAALVVATLVLVCSLGLYHPGAWSQSPVPSPASPTSPWGHPMTAVSPVEASPAPPFSLQRLFASSVWLSPLPWIGLGLVLFGLLAWALYALLHRLDAASR